MSQNTDKMINDKRVFDFCRNIPPSCKENKKKERKQKCIVCILKKNHHPEEKDRPDHRSEDTKPMHAFVL